MAVCPEKYDSLNLLDSSLLWAVEKKANRTGTIMDLTMSENVLGGLPYRMDFRVWQKRLQNVKIVSHLFVADPEPKQDEPIEQRLTISYTGRIWFEEYGYDRTNDHFRKPVRKLQYSIGKERAARILLYIANYVKSRSRSMRDNNYGSWKLTACWKDGSKEVLFGTRWDDAYVGVVSLNELIHKEIPIKGLAVFTS